VKASLEIIGVSRIEEVLSRLLIDA
jgi:hypothetical protein